MARNRASSNFSKTGSLGRQRGGGSDVESGVFGFQDSSTALGGVKPMGKKHILVETSSSVQIGPHAYTCETRQEEHFFAGRF